VLQNTPQQALQLGGLEMSQFTDLPDLSKFACTVYVHENELGIEAKLHYSRERFTHSAMQQFAERYRALLEIFATPDGLGLAIAKIGLANDISDTAQLFSDPLVVLE
jgi:hypothetical protein